MPHTSYLYSYCISCITATIALHEKNMENINMFINLPHEARQLTARTLSWWNYRTANGDQGNLKLEFTSTTTNNAIEHNKLDDAYIRCDKYGQSNWDGRNSQQITQFWLSTSIITDYVFYNSKISGYQILKTEY